MDNRGDKCLVMAPLPLHCQEVRRDASARLSSCHFMTATSLQQQATSLTPLTRERPSSSLTLNRKRLTHGGRGDTHLSCLVSPCFQGLCFCFIYNFQRADFSPREPSHKVLVGHRTHQVWGSGFLPMCQNLYSLYVNPIQS